MDIGVALHQKLLYSSMSLSEILFVFLQLAGIREPSRCRSSPKTRVLRPISSRGTEPCALEAKRFVDKQHFKGVEQGKIWSAYDRLLDVTTCS